MPGKRQAGWPSLLVTFLLATQEKSDSPSAGGRNALELKSRPNSKAEQQSRTAKPNSKAEQQSRTAKPNSKAKPEHRD